MKFNMFDWFKRQPTLDETIAATFSEQGRWTELSKNKWTDTKTGATIYSYPSGGLFINEVPVSGEIHRAFWAMIIEPINKAKQEKLAALEKLYADS